MQELEVVKYLVKAYNILAHGLGNMFKAGELLDCISLIIEEYDLPAALMFDDGYLKIKVVS